MLTVKEFAKHFDTAFLGPALSEEEIRKHVRISRDLDVATFYSNTCWTSVVAEELKGSDVRVGAACGFPLGANSTAMKVAEIDEVVANGATSVDLVMNVGAIKSGDWKLVRKEIEAFREHTGKNLAKAIIETCYLTDDELIRVVKLCSEIGIDYAKSGTNTQGKSEDYRVRLMLDSVSGKTKVKVSALPDSFMMAAVLWMIDEGVKLFGTMWAPQRIQEYSDYLTWRENRDNKNQAA